MQQAFNCPTCGAPLSPDGTQAQIKCEYCGTTVVVPESLRSRRSRQAGQMGPETAQYLVQNIMSDAFQQAQINQAQVSATVQKTTKAVSCFVIMIMVIVVISVGLPIILMVVGMSQASQAVAAIPNNINSIVKDLPSNLGQSISSGGDTAPVLMSFGSAGSGSGHFDDMRYVALDGKGNIYTGEYMSGRVQKFDSDGNFIKGWVADGKKFPLRGLGADREGNVYATRGGALLKYDGDSAELLSTTKQTGLFYDDLTVLPDGGVELVNSSTQSDIIRLDSKGKQVKLITDPISQATDDSELSVKIAVDGVGNIYALGSFTYAVYKFSPDGKFINKFSGKGDEPGLLQAPLAIAIDGQSNIYVSDIGGIHVFDSNGRFIKFVKLQPGTVAFGMTFNDNNELYIAARDKVLKVKVADAPR